MEFLRKLFSFFRRTKEIAATTELQIKHFVKDHKKQIKLLINIFDMIFPASTGIKKMSCLVSNVCFAIGLECVSKEAAELVEKECQKVYDEFKASLN